MDNSSLKTHSSSGYFVIIALSFRVLSPLLPTRPNHLLIGETPTLYVGKGIGRNPDIFIEKYIFVLYSLAYNYDM